METVLIPAEPVGMDGLQAQLGPSGGRATLFQPLLQGKGLIPVVGYDAAAVPMGGFVGSNPDYRRLHHFRLNEATGARAFGRTHHVGGRRAAGGQDVGGYTGAFQVLGHDCDRRLVARFGRAVGRAALAPRGAANAFQ